MSVYEEISVSVCYGKDALTSQTCKELLGWKEVEGSEEFHFKDRNGKKIRCRNNESNRPLSTSDCEKLAQSQLYGQWEENGETIIIGAEGTVLDGQHSMIANVLATQDWEKDPEKYPIKGPPKLKKIVVTGIDESDRVVNTINTGRSRSLADVIYRSQYFSDMNPKERKSISRSTSYAVRLLMQRLGDSNAFAPIRTLDEMLHVLDTYPRLLQAVHHAWVEGGEEFIFPGYGGCLVFLMGVSATDPMKFIQEPCQESLDFSNWDAALEFYTLMAAGAKVMAPLVKAFSELTKDEEGLGVSRLERIGLIAKAWNQWKKRGKLSRISLRYLEEDGGKVLVDFPSVGGIDMCEFSDD